MSTSPRLSYMDRFLTLWIFLAMAVGVLVGLAAAQAPRGLPHLVMVVVWQSYEHLAPDRKGDTVRSTSELAHREPLPCGGGLVYLGGRVRTVRESGFYTVLDWQVVGVRASWEFYPVYALLRVPRSWRRRCAG